MAWALGLKKGAVKTARTPGLRVILSVRHPWGGLPFRFEHVEQTISELQAEMEARKAARRLGYQVWTTVEITRDDQLSHLG